MAKLMSDTRKGIKKAAIFLITIGPDAASKVMSQLSESEVEEISVEIANFKDIVVEQKEAVLKEFYEDFIARDSFDSGGISYAQDILEKAFGKEKARKMSEKLIKNLSTGPFRFLKDVEPEHLLNMLKSEHPQTIALILTYLPYELASKILCSLKPELQAEVGVRIAQTDRTSPEVIKKMEELLSKKIKNYANQNLSVVGGVETIVGILNQVDRGTEKSILSTLEKKNKTLAEEVRNLLFVFEDILKVDDRAIQRVLKEVDTNLLGKALKGSSKEVKDKIFKNMSERASMIIQEDMEAMGPLRITDVETAQQSIVKKIKDLEDAGEIILARGNEEIVV